MSRTATIHRIVSAKHACPWGIKAIDLLRRKGFTVDDHHLDGMEAAAAYKAKNGYEETPQIAIDGEPIGGYDQLREHLGLGPDPREGTTYVPVIAVFAVTFLLALTTCIAIEGAVVVVRAIELFIAFSMVVLGILKLQDLQSFATGFVQYDLIARRYVPYSYLYPFVETGAGILMVAGIAIWVAAPIVLIVSTIGAISVFRAVYVQKRDLNCACVGGGSSVPLGFVSLTENLMMIAMSIWMMAKTLF